MSKIFVAFLVLGLIVASCTDEEKPRTIDLDRSGVSKQPSLRIKASNTGDIFFGDTIFLNVSPTEENLKISNVRISTPGKFELNFDSSQTNLSIPTSVIGGGNQRLKFDVDFTDGQKSTRYKEFLVLAAKEPNEWEFNTVRKYDHDPTSFTQGLLIYNGFLYEGTGNYKESRLRKLDLSSGKVIQEKEIEPDIFGEGITIFDNKIYQLTYKSSRAFVYDLESFNRLDEYIFNSYTSEGWGLTHNDSVLIASDGSSYLYFLDPDSFGEVKRMKVFDNLGEVDGINELEYIDGTIYANIYTTAKIVAIDAKTGRVTDSYVARGIVDQSEVTSNMDVLNGIAINPQNGHLLITGKYWSKIYEVQPIPVKES